ncbi:peptide/nickel transport system substrate-binding protein [Halomicrobium zhouii]|uniref:Peptide/nickel transport system substrate-binding protein n=1 Tax=Halomicrobium zhouii TaxID=767519 RepID=A0A1I6KRU5_9EURY|nr:ABC transporter substrate-binding protein [Halomicrobium zhouii]SFR93952.1 peptide/nickel transport system substrate-binding protein [Halomicrobium zhouii]
MSTEHEVDRRSFVKLAGGAAASAAIAGCSGDGDDEATETDPSGEDTEGGSPTETETGTGEAGDGEFAVTITQGQAPTTLDPHNHRDTPTDNVALHVYEGVLSRDRTGEVIEKLATGYERVEDGVVRFEIREDVQFHNGDDLTPEDVAYSVNRIVDEEVGLSPSPQSDQLAGVTGASVVDGERAVEVQSDGFNPVVFSVFATYGDVVQRSWIEETDTVGQDMNGTGPFQLASYEEDVEVVLERNEDYWRESADVSELTFRSAEEASTRVNQLLENETDVAVNVPPQEVSRVRNADNADVAAEASTRLLFCAMRYDVEPFSSQQFRQAMNYAIDLESIIQNVLQTFGDQTSQPTLEGFVGYNDELDPYPQDTDQAEQLVEDSGHAGVEIELQTPVGRYLRDVQIAQAVGEQINQLSNVSCSVNQRDFESLAGEVTDGDIETSPPFYLLGWGEATFEGSQTITALLTSDGALTSYSNEEVDQVMADAQSEPDAEERESLLQEANQLLHEQAPWVYLNRQYSVYGVSNRVDWQARSDERIDAYAMSPN